MTDMEKQMKEVLDRIGNRLDSMEQQIEEKEKEAPSGIDKLKAYAFPVLVGVITWFGVRIINTQDESTKLINQMSIQIATMQAQLGFVMAKSKLDEGALQQKKTLKFPITYLDALHSNEIEITNNNSPQNLLT